MLWRTTPSLLRATRESGDGRVLTNGPLNTAQFIILLAFCAVAKRWFVAVFGNFSPRCVMFVLEGSQIPLSPQVPCNNDNGSLMHLTRARALSHSSALTSSLLSLSLIHI